MKKCLSWIFTTNKLLPAFTCITLWFGLHGCSKKSESSKLKSVESNIISGANVGSVNASRSSERGHNLIETFKNVPELRKNKTRLAFTGRDFTGTCETSGRIFLPDRFTQSKLLASFSHGKDLFKTYIKSLEDTDTAKVRAPATPAHPILWQRLGGGTNPDKWQLNLVRFRTDHIKINFELPLITSEVDSSIEFAALIHAFRIPSNLVSQYQAEIAAMDQSPGKVACSLDAFLTKWLNLSEYFFIHSNIFDLVSTVKEWRFTEGKLVTPGNVILAGKATTSIDLANSEYELRLVQMEFPFKQMSNGGKLESSSDGAAYRTFWSGESTDIMIDLLAPLAGGGAVASNHPANENDPAMTCAQCHARGVGAAAVEVPPFPKQMSPVKSMHFRHVGFGVEPPHGVLRLYNEAQFSPYFQQLLLRESGQ